VQSATKTLTSSGFGIAGAVIARRGVVTSIPNDQLKNDFALYIKYLPNRDYGPNLHPMQAILSLNDMRTLRSKMDLFSRSTMTVAQHLEKHPKIEKVEYLGLPNHPLHELAAKYMWLVDAEHDAQYGKPVNRYGHLMSFCVKGGAEAARRVFDRLQRIWRATDLGRVKSVATIPAIPPTSSRARRAQARAHPIQPHPAVRRRRAPRRHPRRHRPGAARRVVSDCYLRMKRSISSVPRSR